MTKPSLALAIACGYTHAVLADSLQYSLELMVQPDADLGERFRAFDTDSNEWLWVNGWMFDIEPVEQPIARVWDRVLASIDAELRAA